MSQSTTIAPALEVAAADSSSALNHFESLLRFETDCWDVHASLAHASPGLPERLSGVPRGFVLLDVRAPDAYAAGHVPGAINLPHGRITDLNLAGYPSDTVFVVYCTGPHCNGADKAAVRLARLNRPVKKMIGGIEGWKDEGFELASA